jgi:hypothetical protein
MRDCIPAIPAAGGHARRLLSAATIALAGLAALQPAQAQTNAEIMAFVRGATDVGRIVRPSQPEAIPQQRLGRQVIPDACRETVQLHRRNVELFRADCVEAYGMPRLPQQCEVPVRTETGEHRYFVAHCMFKAHFRPQTHWYSGRLIWDSPAPRRP